MHQIAYFEPEKCKNSLVWEGDTLSHTLPLHIFSGFLARRVMCLMHPLEYKAGCETVISS